ncbi:MAG: hypothetical protein A3B23_01045 [Candidatus Colwellbacteria bacterium RIFCSPLOWO2_01_FULL_48_10]|uniref:EfeO-type cupredoxin-like domain-containing protein n=1 Tax=Candidatus Colwellbacteria bacterium RIFCSPLOWO2_01_FULL_48_10 TaxID=1797690 RepID=A0A1G1Z4G2_9BACT|nr:MAG: hypothetical protein A3B23_01045 [Candidatus Colwellbacteria bacterium RIFCSPLOWO2_01_FULL_48_10]
MDQKKVLVFAAAGILVVVGAYMALYRQTQNQEAMPAKPAVEETKGNAVSKVVQVTYQNNTFNPKSLEINVGDTVEFVNKHIATIRASANPHPFHESFPEFDSDTLQPGQTYRFTFVKAMTLDYHNHFNPGAGGVITAR